VEPIRHTTREERTAALEAAGYNLFFAQSGGRADRLLTDSGIGRDVVGPMGGHDVRRRVLRRGEVVL